jgi:hypothetical protein
MLNPIQAASTYTCDGCSHHASFHVLKNEEDGDSDFVAPPHQVAGVKRREIVDLSGEEEDEDEEENGRRRINGAGGEANGNNAKRRRGLLTNGTTETPRPIAVPKERSAAMSGGKRQRPA